MGITTAIKALLGNKSAKQQIVEKKVDDWYSVTMDQICRAVSSDFHAASVPMIIPVSTYPGASFTNVGACIARHAFSNIHVGQTSGAPLADFLGRFPAPNGIVMPSAPSQYSPMFNGMWDSNAQKIYMQIVASMRESFDAAVVEKVMEYDTWLRAVSRVPMFALDPTVANNALNLVRSSLRYMINSSIEAVKGIDAKSDMDLVEFKREMAVFAYIVLGVATYGAIYNALPAHIQSTVHNVRMKLKKESGK